MPGLGPGVLGLKQKLSLLPHSSKSVSGGSVTFSPRPRPDLRGEPAAEVLLGLLLVGDMGPRPAAAMAALLLLLGEAGAALTVAAAGFRWDT
jgi:hypothetical protein